MRNALLLIVGALELLSRTAAGAVRIDPSRGVDPRVDYGALAGIAPWDDRNYRLRLEDIARLAPDEADLKEAVPLFFRVELRREIADFPTTGPARYPRSALPKFLLRYGGYLVDGQLFRGLTRGDDGRWTVLERDGVEAAVWAPDSGEGAAREEWLITADAAETAVAYHPSDDQKVIAGSNGPGFAQRMHWSIDGGRTWNQLSLPHGGTCCDPTVAWSSDGAKAYTATLGNTGTATVWIYRSADGGQTWSDLPAVGGKNRRDLGGSGSDKEYLHVDLHATSPCKDRVYVAWHDNGVNKFARSADLAETWVTGAAISSNAAGESGFGSDMTSDTAGNLYYFWPTFDRRILLRKSSAASPASRCGQTFAASVEVADTEASYGIYIPSIESRGAWTYVTAAADRSSGPHGGNVYVAWTDTTAPESDNDPPEDTHARIRVARSTDGGASWSVSTPHETDDLAAVDRWGPWIGVGPDGAVHAVFYDTRNFVDRSGVDLFHAESRDGGVTWSAPEKLTSASSPNIEDSFEFGDYNGFDVSTGNFLAIFTDNRDDGPPAGDNIAAYVAGTRGGIFADAFEFGSAARWSEIEPP